MSPPPSIPHLRINPGSKEETRYPGSQLSTVRMDPAASAERTDWSPWGLSITLTIAGTQQAEQKAHTGRAQWHVRDLLPISLPTPHPPHCFNIWVVLGKFWIWKQSPGEEQIWGQGMPPATTGEVKRVCLDISLFNNYYVLHTFMFCCSEANSLFTF